MSTQASSTPAFTKPDTSADLEKMGSFPRRTLMGPALMGPCAVLSREFGVEVLPLLFIWVGRGHVWTFPLKELHPGAVELQLEIKDLGPHPDNDGSRSTAVLPRLAIWDKVTDAERESLRAKFRMDWKAQPVLAALDEIGHVLLDATLKPAPGVH